MTATDEPQVLRVFDARDRDAGRWRAWPPLMDWIGREIAKRPARDVPLRRMPPELVR